MQGSFTWDDKAFKRKTEDEIILRMATAAKLVEESARSKLLGIQNPKKGREKHRRYVAGLLTHEVTKERKEIRARIGPRATSRSRYYGLYIEIGSSKFPANPYLRPALAENHKRIIQVLSQ